MNMNADVPFVLCYPVPSSLSPRLLDRIEDRGPSSAPPGWSRQHLRHRRRKPPWASSKTVGAVLVRERHVLPLYRLRAAHTHTQLIFWFSSIKRTVRHRFRRSPSPSQPSAPPDRLVPLLLYKQHGTLKRREESRKYATIYEFVTRHYVTGQLLIHNPGVLSLSSRFWRQCIKLYGSPVWPIIKELYDTQDWNTQSYHVRLFTLPHEN